jgi:hypothetical protein
MSARLSLLAPFAVLIFATAGRAQDDRSIPLTADSRLVPRTAADGDSASGWTTSVRLPAIEGPAATDPDWAGLARHLDQIVAAEREAFHENLAEWDPSEPGWLSTFDVDGSVLWAAPPILSIVLDFSVYYAGAAHPGHFAMTVVWDAGRGRALTTRDVFRARSDWEEVLSREVIPILERDLGEMADPSWIEEGAGPLAENFSRWALVEEGLVLFFDPYQVAPYAAGPQAVTIPRAALADVAAPGGPLAPD